MFTVDDFDETGILHLPGAFSAGEAEAMRDTIWRFIEARTTIKADDPSTWPERRPPGLSLKSLKTRAVFAPLVENEALQQALPAIFGSDGWKPPKRSARFLLSFPTPGAWVMPAGWHMDGSFGTAASPVPALQLWAVLADLPPCGGGTLLLAGSHRLMDGYTARLPADKRGGNGVSWSRFLRQDPWLDQLRRGGTDEQPLRDLVGQRHEIDGVAVQPIEVTGRPGDLFVSHFLTFHSAAPNTSTGVRQMLTGTIWGRSQATIAAP